MAVGDSTTESPYEGFMLVTRSGEAGKSGMLGDMASLEGEGGREGGSIFWMGDSLRRASVTVAIIITLFRSARNRCMQCSRATAGRVAPNVFTKFR